MPLRDMTGLGFYKFGDQVWFAPSIAAGYTSKGIRYGGFNADDYNEFRNRVAKELESQKEYMSGRGKGKQLLEIFKKY